MPNKSGPFISDFHSLSPEDLYEILRARVNVFVVEQDCPYPEVDGIDYISTHLFVKEGNEVVAYARVYPDKEDQVWHIGRVLTTRRGEGLGTVIMDSAIQDARRAGARIIRIEAQSYAIGFYEKSGFKVISDEFLMDGIPHVRMEWTD